MSCSASLVCVTEVGGGTKAPSALSRAAAPESNGRAAHNCRPAPAPAAAPALGSRQWRPARPSPARRDQTCFCLPQQRGRAASWFPSPRSHQPLVLITQSESQRIQPESRVKGASGSAGKGQKESGEGGGEAAVGFILSFPGVGRSPPRGAVPPGPSRLPDPSERTPGPSTGQPRPPPPFKFPSCRRWAAPGFRRPAAPGRAAQAGERPGTASARRSAARGGRAALGRPHKGTSVRAGGPPDVFAARSSCGF